MIFLILFLIFQATKNYEWRNIRGPRPYEDNTEFLLHKAEQEERVRKILGNENKTVAKS